MNLPTNYDELEKVKNAKNFCKILLLFPKDKPTN